MRVGALGDVHGDFGTVRRIMGRHPDVPFWLCVGDVADGDGRYESFPAPLYWIKGNNENFDALVSGALPEGLHYIPNAAAIEIEPAAGQPFTGRLRVAGLGGTFAPTWYETPAADLPHPKKSTDPGRAPAAHARRRSEAPRSGAAERGARGGGAPRAVKKDDKRRHFVREEVEACLAFQGIDVFLTHEAPSPFRAFPGGRGPDAGKTVINEILAAVQPRLHLFGHHHRFTEQTIAGVRSVGLDLVSRSYLLIDPDGLGYHVVSTTATDA